MNTTTSSGNPGATTATPSKFLTQVHDAAKRHGHAEVVAGEMVNWCRRFILFHGTKHPQEMGRTEVIAYLEHVAKTEKDPLRGIASAHGAIEFLYHEKPWKSCSCFRVRYQNARADVCVPVSPREHFDYALSGKHLTRINARAALR